MRQIAIELMKGGKTGRWLSHRYNVKDKMVYKIAKLLRTQEGKTKIRKMIESTPVKKLSELHANFLKSFLDNHKNEQVTAKQMRAALLVRFPELNKLSLKAVRDLLKQRLRYRYKKVALRGAASST